MKSPTRCPYGNERRSASAILERGSSTPEAPTWISLPLRTARRNAAVTGETTARTRREEPVDVSAGRSLIVRCDHLVGHSLGSGRSRRQSDRLGGAAAADDADVPIE